MRFSSFHNPKTFLGALAALLLICSAHFSRSEAQDAPSVPEVLAKPSARLDLSAIDYHEPSRMDRLSENEPSVSLNFVDTNHLLLTFNRKKLFQRLPGCSPDHQDRLVHAVVLELPTGKVVNEADWYLHDRRRYLWPLGPGTFLLRKLHDLYLVDSTLREKLLMSSPKDLLWVALTPDGSQIILETANDTSPVKDDKPGSGKPRPRFVAQFLDAKTLAPQRTIPLNEVVDLNGTSTGYVDLVHKGEIWLVRFGSTPSKRRNLARVRSRTVPTVIYAGNNSILIGRCASSNCDYSVTAFTTTGHRLWRQHWSRYRFFAAVAHSEDGSRFAVGTARLAAPASSADTPYVAPDDQDISEPTPAQQDVFQQEVQIIETASGNPVASVNVSPAVLSGQNFSLSPDGRRLAVLRGVSVELFDLPPPSDTERAKFSALQTDIPDLYALASDGDSVPPPGAEPADDNHPADATAPAADASASTSTGKPDSSTANPADAAATAAAESSPSASPAAPTQVRNAPPAATPVATFKVSSKAVVVDVVVTDGNGNPVHGLRQQDFQLAEDGKSQDIRSFREFSDTESPVAADPTPPKPTSPKPSPNLFTNDTRAPDPGAVMLVLFDMLNTPSQDQVYARQQLIKFLESKPKNAQIALCTLTAGTSHLRLVQGFTPDETLLLAAVKGKKGLPKAVKWKAAAAETDSSVSVVGDLAQGGRTSGFQNLLGALRQMQAQQQVVDTEERASITLDAMMMLARYLSAIPGRKNLVWLSGSFPIAILATTSSGDPSLDNPNYTARIRRTTNLLAEAQIAVYPVDVRGLQTLSMGADSSLTVAGRAQVGPSDFSGNSLPSPGPAISAEVQSMSQLAAEQDTLNQFATSTGGKAFYNSNGIREAITLAEEQGSNYYTVSYSPANKIFNGKFRKIRVQLAQKGYKLHYRQGYFADDTNTAAKEADLARRTRSVAMQQGSPPSRQILFSAIVAPVGGKKKVDRASLGNALKQAKAPTPSAPVEVQHYNIDYTLEGSALRFVPLANATYRNVLTLMVTSFDREGRMLTGTSNVGATELQPAVYNKVITGDFGVRQEVDIPVEAASLRVGIQDQMSNHIGTVDISLPVPPLPDAPRKSRLPEIEPD